MIDEHYRWGNTMANSLRDFIAQVRAARDRGLPITAEDVLDGLEIALNDQWEKTRPIPYERGIRHIEDRVRRFIESLRFDRPQDRHHHTDNDLLL